MDKRFALQALPNASFEQHIHCALLENARPDALFDVWPAAGFNNDGFDPLQVQEMRKQQSCRPGSDNSDLRAQDRPSQWLVGTKSR
jgi:hypothetical protein